MYGYEPVSIRAYTQLYEVGEISQKALQQEVNIDNAAITRHLKQLEANEMIVRRKNPDDNRITLVSLTEEGRNKNPGVSRGKRTFCSICI